MRQADKNRAEKAYDLVAQAEKTLREIKLENMNGRQVFRQIQALNKLQTLRWVLSDFMDADKPE